MFTESWFAAGVVDSEAVTAFARYADNDPAKSARHWRWLAFQDHLEENTPLAPERCRALFQLGEQEPDANLGIGMMCAVLHQRYCPGDLKRTAEESPITAVRRAAIRARLRGDDATR